MLFKTHLIFAFLIGLLTFQYIQLQPQLYIAIIIFAAMIPDIDITTSKLGKHVKIVGYLFTHRGFFHSLLALFLFSYLLSLVIPVIYIVPFFIGYLSHLVLDTLNHQGIMFLYPIPVRIKGFMKTGGLAEIILLILMTIITLFAVII
ncbi:metal-dependent hydrolase [Candidatus Woesearchaeota archaeon]|nr:metal-dependent hydrolase [Candidatus Woesearchaeota archaeon]